MNKPKCAEYKRWVGREIEGFTSLGQYTLFVRECESYHEICPDEFMVQMERLELADAVKRLRIWFCKEFRNWEIIRKALRDYDEVCVEITGIEAIAHKVGPSIPEDLINKLKIYVKFPHLDWLPRGSHVCIGQPFEDESFLIGAGQTVNSEHYKYDIKLA